MRRLIDGVHAIIQVAPALSELRDLDRQLLTKIPVEDQAELARLSTGEPEDSTPGSLFKRLRVEGFADEGLDPIDPKVYARLQTLGEGFTWTLPRTQRDEGERDALSALLRRVHARRKSFLYAFGQTYCTPEAGAARCLQLTKNLPTNNKVLLVGDDDLLSLPLAALGYEVTTIDIDELVISFIKRTAHDEGLSVDARVYDVLAPLDEQLVGAYDAVFTDPMSYEQCFLAFWSRGLSVLKVGGRLVTCIQPYTRHVFKRLLDRLPARVESYRYRFNSYYSYSFAENLYRSDLVEMIRQPGEVPYAPADRIPFTDITEGMISGGYHAFGQTHGMRMALPRHVTASMISDALVNSGRYRAVNDGAVEDDVFLHSFLSTEEGGHLAVVLDRQRAEIAFSGYPWNEEREQWLMLLLKQTVRGVTAGLWYADAARLPARPVFFENR